MLDKAIHTALRLLLRFQAARDALHASGWRAPINTADWVRDFPRQVER